MYKALDLVFGHNRIHITGLYFIQIYFFSRRGRGRPPKKPVLKHPAPGIILLAVISKEFYKTDFRLRSKILV